MGRFGCAFLDGSQEQRVMLCDGWNDMYSIHLVEPGAHPLQPGWVSWDHFNACNTASEVERMDRFRVYEPVSLYTKAKLNDEWQSWQPIQYLQKFPGSKC